MNCDTVSNNIRELAADSVSDREWMRYIAHIDSCPNCRAALRGAEALVELKHREVEGPTAGLLERVVAAASNDSDSQRVKQRFWTGAAFGGAIAASLFAIALTFGWIDSDRSVAANTAEFTVSLYEPRQMNLAFETDRVLEGATISILLSGDVGIEGYGTQHELTWTDDLDAGLNRLSLPVIASSIEGGQMVVRLSHPDSEQVFVINLRTES